MLQTKITAILCLKKIHCELLFCLQVKNKLDGREYAVKKVPLKETDPDLCLKVQTRPNLINTDTMETDNIIGASILSQFLI